MKVVRFIIRLVLHVLSASFILAFVWAWVIGFINFMRFIVEVNSRINLLQV